MTIDEIKRELPTVKVRYCGKVHDCPIKGRLLDYPSVILPGDIPIQFCWATIQHSINTGSILVV